MVTEMPSGGNEPHGSTSAASDLPRQATAAHVYKGGSRRSGLAALLDPALDRNRNLLHPPVDAAAPFAAALKTRAGFSKTRNEAAHPSDEHNRELERRQGAGGGRG